MRVIVAFVLVAVVIAAVFALTSYQRIVSTTLSEREDVALRQTYANARVARARLRVEGQDPGSVVASLESRRGTPVLRYGGEWFGTTVGVGRDQIPSEMLRVVSEGSSARQRIRVSDQLVTVVGVPLPAIEAEYYEFVPLGDLDDTLAAVRRSLLLGAGVAAAAGALLGALVSRTVLRPLGRLTDAATAVRRGDLETRVEPTGDRDLDPLLETFNSMVDELSVRIERDKRFAGDVTHELRGPLAAMAAAVDHARRHADDPARVRFALDALGENVDHFSSLVVDLLEMSQMDAGSAVLNAEPVHVREFLAAVVATGGRPVPIDVADDVPERVVFDKRRIGQCVANLLQNAERYGGGAVAVSARRSGDRLQLVVDDAGPGVPEHERDHIFGRFARGASASEVAGGTGLGLALVVEHARLHRGTVTVGDRPGGGARFTIDIELVEP